jgi:TRAP-type C4-dicarboxylate transport system permease small subunit
MKSSIGRKGFLKRVLYHLAKYLDRVTWLLLFVMMMITVTDVFLRKFTPRSVLGSVELTEMMMIMVVFCSLAECQVHDGHIKVDLVLKRFPPRVQAFFDVVTQFICFLLFSLMCWALFRHANNLKEWGEVTVDLALPVYPFIYVAAIGCGLLALVLLAKTAEAFYEIEK